MRRVLRLCILFALHFLHFTFYLDSTFPQHSTDIALLYLHFNILLSLNILLTLLASGLPLLDYAATQGGSRVVDAN